VQIDKLRSELEKEHEKLSDEQTYETEMLKTLNERHSAEMEDKHQEIEDYLSKIDEGKEALEALRANHESGLEIEKEKAAVVERKRRDELEALRVINESAIEIEREKAVEAERKRRDELADLKISHEESMEDEKKQAVENEKKRLVRKRSMKAIDKVQTISKKDIGQIVKYIDGMGNKDSEISQGELEEAIRNCRRGKSAAKDHAKGRFLMYVGRSNTHRGNHMAYSNCMLFLC